MTSAITRKQIRKIVKEELRLLSEEMTAIQKASLAWLKDKAFEEVQEEFRDAAQGKLQDFAEELLKNPNIAGGRIGAALTKVAGGVFTAAYVYEIYSELANIASGKTPLGEWNDTVQGFLSTVQVNLAKTAPPRRPQYWGSRVKSCDDLSGYATKWSCEAWLRSVGGTQDPDDTAATARARDRIGRHAGREKRLASVDPGARRAHGETAADRAERERLKGIATPQKSDVQAFRRESQKDWKNLRRERTMRAKKRAELKAKFGTIGQDPTWLELEARMALLDKARGGDEGAIKQYREKYSLSENKKKVKNKYAVCTISISKKTGTRKRSEWTDAEMKRYERCKEKVK